jgi:hypothetical protein
LSLAPGVDGSGAFGPDRAFVMGALEFYDSRESFHEVQARVSGHQRQHLFSEGLSSVELEGH